MRVAAKLREWQAAGVIDDASAAAILAHEEARERPVALFAVAGLGLLALALGLFSLVAANWDDMPAAVKLGGHVVLMVIAATAAVYWVRRDRLWAGEGALFLLAALTLAGIALQSQVYQLTGELWQALAWWAVLVTPVVLMLGRTRLTAYGLALGLTALVVAYWSGDTQWLGDNLSLALPPSLVLAALALPGDGRRVPFRDGLFEFGFAAALIGASVAHIAWASSVSTRDAATSLASLPLAALCVVGAGLLAFRDRPRREAELIAVVLAGSLIAVLLALGLPHDARPGARFAGVASYLALWGGVAGLATRAGWHRLFRVAVAAIAVRLFIVYFELFYSLAFTGFGLVVGGLLLIGLAWAWARIVRGEAS